jgi:hypothetical protein
LNAFRAQDASLRRVYAHYATLEMYSAEYEKNHLARDRGDWRDL